MNKVDEHISIHKHSSCADNVWEIIGFPKNSTLSVFFDLQTTRITSSETSPRCYMFSTSSPRRCSCLLLSLLANLSRGGKKGRKKNEHRGGKKFVENPSIVVFSKRVYCKMWKFARNLNCLIRQSESIVES